VFRGILTKLLTCDAKAFGHAMSATTQVSQSPPHGQRACIEPRQDAPKQWWKWKVKKVLLHHTEHSSESVRALEKNWPIILRDALVLVIRVSGMSGQVSDGICSPEGQPWDSCQDGGPKRSRASRAPGWPRRWGRSPMPFIGGGAKLLLGENYHPM
jgi:hypothetical protein